MFPSVLLDWQKNVADRRPDIRTANASRLIQRLIAVAKLLYTNYSHVGRTMIDV